MKPIACGVVILAFALAGNPPGRAQTTRPVSTTQPSDPPAIRLFRLQAMVPAVGIETALNDTSLDEPARRELTSQIDQLKKQVNAKADELRPKAQSLTYDQISTMASDISEQYSRELDKWSKAHPKQWEQIQRTGGGQDLFTGTLMGPRPEDLVKPLIEAGLDPSKDQQARKIIADARQAMEKLNQQVQAQQAKLAELPPQQQQIVSQLIGLDMQMQMVRLARSVHEQLRALVSPSQQKAFDELLQKLPPPGEGAVGE